MANASNGLQSVLGLQLLEAEIEKLLNPLPMWLVVVEAVLLVFAVCCNLLVLYNGLSKKNTRSSTFYLLLLNHTFTNLLLSAIVYPGIVYKLRVGLSKNAVEVQHCKYNNFCMLWILTVGLLTNGFAAVNRALSCHPLSAISTRIRSRKVTFLVVIVIWIVGFIIYIIPPHLYQKSWFTVYGCLTMNDIVEAFMTGQDILKYAPTKYIVFWGFLITLVITLVVNIGSYITILKYLLQKHGQGSESEQRKKEKRRALIVIVVLFLTLLLCWLPFLCIFLIDPSQLTKNYVYLFLPALETFLDPVLYMFTMPAFRPKLFRLYRRRTAPENSMDSYSTTATRTAVTRLA